MTNQPTPEAEEAQLDENQIIALRREKLTLSVPKASPFPIISAATPLPATWQRNMVRSKKPSSTRGNSG